MAKPMLFPVTTGFVAEVVVPAGINRLFGEMLTVAESLLASATTSPPTGAGAPSVTESAADSPRATETPLEMVIVPGACTVMLTVDSAISGRCADVDHGRPSRYSRDGHYGHAPARGNGHARRNFRYSRIIGANRECNRGWRGPRQDKYYVQRGAQLDCLTLWAGQLADYLHRLSRPRQTIRGRADGCRAKIDTGGQGLCKGSGQTLRHIDI